MGGQVKDADAAPKIPGPGEVLAEKYSISRVLGQGGMGCVVAARHLLLNQDVAIKFLPPHGAQDPQFVKRFLREAQTAASIRSEHVVRVLDIGVLGDGVPYMVMEYLDGEDLGARVDAGGPLSVGDAAEFTLQACEALAEAHAAGLAHRDIKPSNLFVTKRSDGSPLIKLLDFGIAKAQSSIDGSLTATGAMMGSPSYMSPEQVRDSKTVDARTDIWPLGATLHELLTGAPPFRGRRSPPCARPSSPTRRRPSAKSDPTPPPSSKRLSFNAWRRTLPGGSPTSPRSPPR